MDETNQSKPVDLDGLLTVDEFLTWLRKELNRNTRRWAIDNARKFHKTRGKRGIPAVKLGKEYFFQPRTILAFKPA